MEINVHKLSPENEGLTSFETSVYRKPTFNRVYTRWDSFTAQKYKINLIKCLANRAVRIMMLNELPACRTSTSKTNFFNKRVPEETGGEHTQLCGSPKTEELRTGKMQHLLAIAIERTEECRYGGKFCEESSQLSLSSM